jgi:tRNA(Leu) C34 or U34 (ribose-2'-O)-methylase TrmL
LDDILARAAERGEPPFVLALDSLEDPHNVGSLLRSAEAAGVHGVIFPTHRQAPLSPSAIKASAGAIEHLLLSPTDDLPAALSDLHLRGLRIAGADGNAPLTARQADLRGPLAIVVGSEGQGLGPAIRRRCDVFMRIPMKGAVGSLNAAVAGSILLFEALAQREDGQPPPEEPQAEAAGGTDTDATTADAPVRPKGTRRAKAEDASPAETAEAPTRPKRTRKTKPDEGPPTAETDSDLLPADAAPKATKPNVAKPRKPAPKAAKPETDAVDDEGPSETPHA